MKRRSILRDGSSGNATRRAGRGAWAVPIIEHDSVPVDRYRSIVFPNRIREYRKRAGMPKLLALASVLPHIPYIRLSKIERGEVVAKAHELVSIAQALHLSPEHLLIDIDDADFDIEVWAEGLQDWVAIDLEEDRLSVLLAAAIRARRERDKSLTIATIERDFGIPPVILSRLENAFKPLSRWNEQTIGALYRLFDVPDIPALKAHITMLHAEGALSAFLGVIANPSIRIAKTRARIDALRSELAGDAAPTSPQPGSKRIRPENAGVSTLAPIQAPARLLSVYGAPMAGGLIARSETGEHIEAPGGAGPRAYGLRVCRPTLGPALPGRATVIVDPDRFPSAGSLAAVNEGDGIRLLTIAFSRSGEMKGFSEHPALEIPLDAVDPLDIATVIGAIYE